MVQGRVVVYAVGERDVSADVLGELPDVALPPKPTPRVLARVVTKCLAADPPSLDLTVGAGNRSANMEPLPMLAATLRYLREQHVSATPITLLFVVTDQSDVDGVSDFHKERDTLVFDPVLRAWARANGVKVADPVVSREPAVRTYALGTLLGELSTRVRDLRPDAVSVVLGPSTPAHQLTLTLLLADGLSGVRDVEYVELHEDRTSEPPSTTVAALDMPRLFDGPTARQAVQRRLEAYQPAHALDVVEAFPNAFDEEWTEQLRQLVAKVERHDPVDDPLEQLADMVDRLELGALAGWPPWQQLFELSVLVLEILPNAWYQRYRGRHPGVTLDESPDIAVDTLDRKLISRRTGVDKNGGAARILLASAAPVIHREYETADQFVEPHWNHRRFDDAERSRSLLWLNWWREMRGNRNALAHTYASVTPGAPIDNVYDIKTAADEAITMQCQQLSAPELTAIDEFNRSLDAVRRALAEGQAAIRADTPDWPRIISRVKGIDHAQLRRAGCVGFAQHVGRFRRLSADERSGSFTGLQHEQLLHLAVSGEVSTEFAYVVGLITDDPEPGQRLSQQVDAAAAALWFRARLNADLALDSVRDEALEINCGLDMTPAEVDGKPKWSPLRLTLRRFLHDEDDEPIPLSVLDSNELIADCQRLAEQLVSGRTPSAAP